MKKYGSILFTLLLTLAVLCPLQAENYIEAPSKEQTTKKRPTIAVVLAGGGAKGMAHVSVLKAIEDAGIPIDIVVGTSMGSIIGGLYSAGYSPTVLRQVIENTEWMQLVLDNPDYGTGMMSSRMNMETYALRFNLKRARKVSKTGMGGLLEAENVQKMLQQLLSHIPDTVSYNELPIKFACVGTDLATGDAYVMRDGNLPQSIRTSMAIPTVFTPVIINGRSYVDGGVVDNFPVDVARQMGADVVIGVNLVRTFDYDGLNNNALEVLMQVMSLSGQEITEENIKNSDIYIPVDVNGFSAASFGTTSIDTLLKRGEEAIPLVEEKLKKLHDDLHLSTRPDRIRKGEFSYDQNGHIHIHSTRNDDSAEEEIIAKKALDNLTRTYKSKYRDIKSAMGIGFRYDSYEYVSFLLGADFVLNKKSNLNLNLQARLGSRSVFTGDLSTRTIKNLRFGLKYHYKFWNVGDHYGINYGINNYDYMEHLSEAYLYQEWRYFSWKGGLAFVDTRIKNLVSPGGLLRNDTREYGLVPFLKVKFNNLNHQYFSTSGTKVELGFKYYTNLHQIEEAYTYGGKSESIMDAIPKFHFEWQSAFSFGDRFTILPHCLGTLIVGPEQLTILKLNETDYSGLGSGIQWEDQLAFCGYNKVQSSTYNVLTGGLTLQQRILKKHYIVATAESLKIWGEYSGIKLGEKRITGVSLGYNIRTNLGPITFEGRWNDNTQKVYLFFNMGYYF